MAKQDGPLKIRGKVGPLVFFRNQFGSYVREHRVLNPNRFKDDSKFARQQENVAEFKRICLQGKTLRQAVAHITNGIADNNVVARVTQVMSELKKLDTTSTRGERSPATGLNTAQGKLLLQGFDFNSNARLNNLVNLPFDVDPVTGSISINGFVPKPDLKYPASATHVKVRGAWVKLDLGSGQWETVDSNTVILAIDQTVSNLQLTMPNAPTLAGISLFVVSLEYLQEVNGQQYPIRNLTHTACSVVAVN